MIQSRKKKLSLSDSGVLFFTAATSMIMFAEEVLHAFIHEVLGHGLAAILVGQQVEGVFISPFGIDYTFITMSPIPSLAVIQYAAGTVVSVSFGILVWKFVYPRVKTRSSFGLRLFTLFFVIMLETDLLYTFMSPLFGFGDAFEITKTLSFPPALLSLVILPVIVAVYYPVLREYLEFLAPFASDDVLQKTSTRFRFLLKITYAPVLLFLAIAFVVTAIFSGLGIALFTLIGEVIMILPMILAIFVASKYYDPSRRKIASATASEAENARYSLLGYAMFSIALVLIIAGAFGPTYESARCCGSLS